MLPPEIILFYVVMFSLCIWAIWYGLKKDTDKKDQRRRLEELEKKERERESKKNEL